MTEPIDKAAARGEAEKRIISTTEAFDPQDPGPGNEGGPRVSVGGVDVKTGATTGAMAGGLLGFSGGPVGFLGGVLLGGVLGGWAASGHEHPYYPEHWQERRAELHQHSRAEAREAARGESPEATEVAGGEEAEREGGPPVL